MGDFEEVLELTESNKFSLLSETLFVKIFGLIPTLNPFEEIEGDYAENQQDKSTPIDILNIKPIHEIVQVLMYSFGFVIKKMSDANLLNNLFEELYAIKHPLDDYISYDDMLQSIRNYQKEQWIK